MNRITTAAGLLTISVLIGACGGKDDAPAQDGEVADPAPAAEETEDDVAEAPAAIPSNFIYSLSVDLANYDGDLAVPPTEELRMTGGCDGNSVVSIGFSYGQATADNWFNLAFDTQDVVGTRETGSFPLSRLVLDDGVTVPANLPDDTTVRVPNRLEGEGTLSLDMHEASLSSRRMSGTLTGTMGTNADGDPVELDARFDIFWSCGV